MPFKSLPSNPNLDHLKHQARDLQKALQAHELQAFQRVREFHPRFRKASDAEIGQSKLTLSDVQLVIAREYCFPSWTKLRTVVQAGLPADSGLPQHERIVDPTFKHAVDLLDAGNEAELLTWLKDHPEVVRQKVFFNINDYFGQPSLLEFVAENPVRRGKLPANIVAITRIVLDAGARDDRREVDVTMGLVVSGRVARECGVQIALIDLLCDYGGHPGAAISAALVHGEFDAVEALVRRGALVDLPVAAATGRTEEARRLRPTSDSDARRRALAYSTQCGRIDIVRLLLDSGEDPNRFNPMGCHSHSTPLHQAALSGNVDVVRLLIEHGADPAVKDIIYGGTPEGWAKYEGRTEVERYLSFVSEGRILLKPGL